MGQYLVDTNIISKYLSNALPEKGLVLIDSLFDDIPQISIISEIEILCWEVDLEIERQLQLFIQDCKILNIDSEIVKQCVQIRRERKTKTPDAIIAATALVHQLTLVTENERDFLKIKGLKILNPMKI